MKNLLTGFILAVLLFLSGSLVAPDSALAQTKPNTTELRKFQELGGKLVFLGNQYGLDGWLLVERDGTPRSVIYTMQNGTMIRGTLFNSAGLNVTKSQMEVYKARTSGSQKSLDIADTDQAAMPKSELFYSQLEKSNWVRVGKPDAPYMYMIINTNCEHCQDLFRTLKGSADKGNLQIRLVPLGKEGDNIVGGPALLSVEDPGKAWSDYMDGNRGALAKEKITGDAEARFAANNKLAKSWPIKDMPMTVYRKLADGVVTVIMGQPENPLVIQADLLKTP